MAGASPAKSRPGGRLAADRREGAMRPGAIPTFGRENGGEVATGTILPPEYAVVSLGMKATRVGA
jgi:hypothetical protein